MKRISPLLIAAVSMGAHATVLPVADDTYVSSASKGTVYGNYKELAVDAERTTLLRLDATSIPETAQGNMVEGASLWLFLRGRSATPIAVDIGIPSGTWSEEKTNYNNRPAIGGFFVTNQLLPNQVEEWVRIDVSKQVRDFVDDGNPNKKLEFAIKHGTSALGAWARFDSKVVFLDITLQSQGGIRGAQGPKGDQGDIGPIGPQGARGYTGSAGAQGPQGQGGAGPQGAQGSRGYSGVQGAQGEQGPGGTGPQGAQGLRGYTGSAGAQGPQGEQGPGGTGPQGAQGPRGYSGVRGAQGEQGPGGTGPQGAQGPQGPRGYAGPQGAQGIAGSLSFETSFYGSKLISNRDGFIINTMIGNPFQKWSLCYSWYTQNESPSSLGFHRACDQKGPLVSIMKANSDNRIIGGYSSCSFASNGSYANCPGSFLFSLLNGHKYELREAKYAVLDHASYGPSFGYGDFRLEQNLVDLTCSGGGTYIQRNRSGITFGNDLCGALTTTINSLEIWTQNQ